MATKAELQAQAEEYHAAMALARGAEARGLYLKAIEHAFASLTFVDGMMQYKRKYEDRQFESVESIDFILRYAPALLGYQYLEQVEDLLKTRKRVEKNTSEDLREKLAEASARLRNAYRLWDCLEEHSGWQMSMICDRLGGESQEWSGIIKAWELMHLVRKTGTGRDAMISLTTRTGEIVPGKCSACGCIENAPKAMFWEPLNCPKCGKRVYFVILSQVSQG